MATKRKPDPAETKPRNKLQVPCEKGGNPDEAIARTLTRPEVQAASVIQQFGGDNHEINALTGELAAQVKAVNAGDMRRAEAMLISQAHTLDEIFASLARRAHANIEGGYLDAVDRYMRLAFKAQSQCRTTLEALAEIKNPRPVAFVKQANIAHGPQQVNNGIPSPPAREKEIEPNKLSEVGNELLPDTRASGSECSAMPTASALGEVDRAEVPRG